MGVVAPWAVGVQDLLKSFMGPSSSLQDSDTCYLENKFHK